MASFKLILNESCAEAQKLKSKKVIAMKPCLEDWRSNPLLRNWRLLRSQSLARNDIRDVSIFFIQVLFESKKRKYFFEFKQDLPETDVLYFKPLYLKWDEETPNTEQCVKPSRCFFSFEL